MTQPWTIVACRDATCNLSADRSGTLTKTTFGPIIDMHHMFLDESHSMVSLAGLRSLGFHCKYSPSMNMVMMERWRE